MAKAGTAASDHVLVACSGGADSTALLDVLARLAPTMRLKLTVASFDHGLRPEAAEEVAGVEALAERLGLDFVSGAAEREDYPDPPSQEAARKRRLAWLEQTRGERGADWIATGHTADDQAETIIMRLIRGAGPTGLAGIRPVSGRLIRPLLTAERAWILAYLDQRGLGYVEDPSNKEARFLRSRVRHRILPLLKEENPNLVAGLTRLAELVAAEDGLLAELGRATLGEIGRVEPGLAGLDRAELAALHPALARRTVRAALEAIKGDLRRFEATGVDDLIALAERGSGRLRLPAGLRGEARGRELVVFDPAIHPPKVLEAIEIPGPGVYTLSTGARLEVETMEGPIDPAGDPDTAVMDASAVAWPLLVRPPEPGDRIEPLGLGGTKKLSDLFIDRKVPRHRRALTPVVVSRGRIVWVAGLALAHAVRIGPETQAALRIRLLAATRGTKR